MAANLRGKTNLSIAAHTLGMLAANITYCITFLKRVNESQMNAHMQGFD